MEVENVEQGRTSQPTRNDPQNHLKEKAASLGRVWGSEQGPGTSWLSQHSHYMFVLCFVEARPDPEHITYMNTFNPHDSPMIEL